METRARRLRKSERKQVLIVAQCRRKGGVSHEVSIVDLSAEGCCITYPASTLAVCQPVIIKPLTMQGISGTVRWVSPEGAGIEFDRALYAPVAEHLQRQFAVGRVTVSMRMPRPASSPWRRI